MQTIRELREIRGWSRAELARRASMNAGTIGQIEAGRLIPYQGQLAKIAAAFEVETGRISGEASA